MVYYGRAVEELLDKKKLDCLAITINETISKMLHNKLGDKSLLVKRYNTERGNDWSFLNKLFRQGFLQKHSIGNSSTGRACYIPHPFETMRLGMQRTFWKKLLMC